MCSSSFVIVFLSTSWRWLIVFFEKKNAQFSSVARIRLPKCHSDTNFTDSTIAKHMVWETRPSLKTWFEACQCQLSLVNLHVELGLFSPSSNSRGGISFLVLPASRSHPIFTFVRVATARNQMGTRMPVPNLLHRARAKTTVRS